MAMPQLRIRSGYSFRNAYGRVNEIAARMEELGCTSGAMVDGNTWGHVRWEKGAAKAKIAPMFGMEVPIILEPYEEGAKPFVPKAWILAKDTREFYRTTTKIVQGKGLLPEEFAALGDGVIRFLGGALGLPPTAVDYVDLNPSSVVHARDSYLYAKLHDLPMVVTSYNDYPSKELAQYAYAWEVRDSVGMRWIASEEEIWSVLRQFMPRADFEEAVRNTHSVSESLKDVKLLKAPIIHLEGDLTALAREGQASRLARGHIAEWTKEYEDRFNLELEQIKMKDFDSYFLVVSDLVRYAKRHMLVGPARGSSAGSLICYLIDITEVDPLPHDLLFQRFIDISRSDLPDIDIDFTDTKRFMVFDYLRDKYGAANVAKLGNINTLQANSVMAQVGKKFGIPFNATMGVKNALISYSSGDARYGKGLEDTFQLTQPGQEFRQDYPAAADCMSNLEVHPSHTGVHAAGILVCNDPISDFCTVTEEGIAQIDKPDSEYLNLLKIDALGLRTLGIIEDSGVVTAEELYSLKLDDPAVFKILNDDKVGGIFQFEGDAVRSVTRAVDVKQFSTIDNLTALGRPGPLASGMSVKYIARANGSEPVTYDVPQLEPYLKATLGVFLYQEQIMSVVKEIGLFDWVKTSAVRKAMSGSKGEEYFNTMGADFVAGATSQGIAEDQAKKMWQEMVTFGAWGFNKSHSVSYAIITYWTCWLKHYHKLEFSAACLRTAKDDEQTIAILREMAAEGIHYTPIDPEFSEMHWKVADGRLIGGIRNAKGFGPVKALKFVQDREKWRAMKDLGPLRKKDMKSYLTHVESLAKAEVLYSDLSEAHSKFGAAYADPRTIGVTSGNPITNMRDVKHGDTGLVIGKLTRKILADENEAIRIKKRGGSIRKGQTQFIDLMLVDDSVDTSWRFRIRPEKFLELGKPAAENDPIGTWYLIKGWRLTGMDMFIVKNLKKIG